MTNLQRVLLDSLRDSFGVDVSDAEKLDGDELELWLREAESRLFSDLVQTLPMRGK